MKIPHPRIAKKLKEPPRNKTGYKGVKGTPFRTYEAHMSVDGKRVRLGTYPTPEEAARAYDRGVSETWGTENCYLNFPEHFEGVEE